MAKQTNYTKMNVEGEEEDPLLGFHQMGLDDRILKVSK